MLNKRTLGAFGFACCAALAQPASAATSTTGDLSVIAVVADTCILATGTALSFATVNTATTSNEVTPGLVTVTCTATRSAITVTLDGGDNLDGSDRQMKSTNNDLLPYEVFSDSGHTEAVAVNGTIYDKGVTAAIPQVIPVYGQVPAGSYNAGAYSDTITVTLNY
ncbi:spore coat U domain-containing protein [Aquicoccus sp. G2-2]|jgi:spore coat protein U-like protein|uniref:Csu type fimbrial protein n=1 Tax=Aquicoccus sp. G2-2 TaxID=3092120 RepID=UPI002AE0730C|nr:spore coat protein U domain-containing protein [Aquicoccus sp. G2-2]MEA1113610.1 spore coat protein U domain-containing protein [Aquicoccus sp. G2-2]